MEKTDEGILFIKNVRLVDSSMDCEGAILVENGVISRVLSDSSSHSDIQRLSSFVNPSSVIDGKGLTLMPSFVDMHTHSRYPGQPQKEEIDTFTKACAAGGFGTVVCMANTTPVISSIASALSVEKAINQSGLVHAIQAVSITHDFDGTTTSHLDDLGDLQEQNSSQDDIIPHVPFVSEDGRDVESSSVMLDAMSKCAASGAIVSCHCEDNSLAAIVKPIRLKEVDTANRILALAEDCSTMRNLEIASAAGCRIHIAHVSTHKSIEAVHRAKKCCSNIDILSNLPIGILPVTCEVTPHHLALNCNNPEMLRHVVNPPLRPENDRLAIVDAIVDGTVDVIATDHAPHTAEDKVKGAPGFSGLETAFAVCYTELVKKGIIPLQKLSALMSDNPARILGLQKKKNELTVGDQFYRGRLKAGYVADVVLVDTDMEWTVNSSSFASKGKYSPFDGMTLTGKIVSTYLAGKKVY